MGEGSRRGVAGRLPKSLMLLIGYSNCDRLKFVCHNRVSPSVVFIYIN